MKHNQKYYFMYQFFLVVILGFSFIYSNAQNDSASVYLQKGLDEKNKGRRMESLKHFEKAYGFNRSSAEITGELASAYYDLRRYQQSKEKYQEFEKLGDKSAQTYRQIMMISYNLRQFPDAIQYAALLEKNYPNEKTAYYSGKSYYALNDRPNTVKHLSIAAIEDEKNADIPYTIARVYIDLENYTKALPFFQQALALDTGNARWHYELGLVYYTMMDNQNALKHMELASKKGIKKDQEFMQNLATAYFNANKYNEGIALLNEMHLKWPSDENITESLALAYYTHQKYNDALPYYEALVEKDSKNAKALFMLGMSYQKLGNKEKGEQLCKKAIELDPKLKNIKLEKKIL
jgi:tetratricopeptide (TPR) repeat protein